MCKYPAITNHIFSGNEQIACNKISAGSLLDYWAWAHSNLMDNAERGAFAEFLVHQAVGAVSKTRVNWDRYDVVSPEGISIEVKASGYIQSWSQEKLSSVSFSIRPTFGWNSETNLYSEEAARQSDVYVFCLLAHKEQETINPMDLSQWEFYVLPTRVLNEQVGDQATIGLAGVKKLGAVQTDYDGLRGTILAAAELE